MNQAGAHSAAAQEAALALSNPKTPAAQIEMIVASYPHLRAQALSHPNCSEKLRAWVSANDPANFAAWREGARAAVQREAQEQATLLKTKAEAKQEQFRESLARAEQAAERAYKVGGSKNAAAPKRRISGGKILLLLIFGLFLGWAYTTLSQTLGRSDAPAAPAVEAAEDGAADSAEQWVRPVVPGSSAQQLVDTPSKNISCELHDTFVACSILERFYQENGLRDCSERLFSIAVEEGAPYLECGQEYLGNPGDQVYEMQYGEQVYWEHFACMAEEDGVSCWNQRTGEGFKFSRQGYTIF
ncbi:MAG: hypothetical protein Q3999_00860 [Buchananella hordeovulneris]|nr:hypothetical protein [Buchananella hordeovulneris]